MSHLFTSKISFYLISLCCVFLHFLSSRSSPPPAPPAPSRQLSTFCLFILELILLNLLAGTMGGLRPGEWHRQAAGSR